MPNQSIFRKMVYKNVVTRWEVDVQQVQHEQELICIESSKCDDMDKKKCKKVARKYGDCEWVSGDTGGKCIVASTETLSQAVSLPFVEDPEKMDDSSSYHVGLNIFAALTAGLLFWYQQ